MSDEPTSDSPVGGELDRRELLKKAGQVGAGVVAAGALAGGASAAKAAPKRRLGTQPKRGGRIVWGLESDPAHVAPFGGILTANHWAKEFAYDSLVEWDKNLNVRPALAEKFEILDKLRIRWTLKKGIRFHNGKEVTSADVKYSVERMLNPPLPGSISTVAQVPAIDRVQVVSKYVFILHLKQSDARVIGFFAWQRYAPIVPEGLYDQINVARNAIGTGPFRMLGYEPNDRIEYVRNTRFWKTGMPYMASMQLKILGDEQARVAALRAGAIDGATLSVDVARSFAQRPERHRPEGAERGVPRAADDDQAGREQAVARPARAPRGQPRDQPRGHHQADLQQRGRVLGARPARVRPVAAEGCGPAEQVPQVRPPGWPGS